MNEDDCLYTSCDAVSCNPALLPVDTNTTTTVVFTSTQHQITTSFWLVWLADCSLSVFLSNHEASHRSPLTASLDTDCVQNNTAETSVDWLQPSTDLRVSSLQCGLSFRSDSSFTPESCRLFPLRSSSLRWEGLDFRAETREAQLISDNLQLSNLNKE